MRPDHTHPLLVTRSFSQLTNQSKKNFLSSTRFVVDAVLEFLAGPDRDDVARRLFLDENRKNKIVMDSTLMNILSSVAEAYENANSSVDRRTILSIVAKQVDYNLLSSVIPGLTRYRYTSARLYSEEYGVGKIQIPLPRTDSRFSTVQVEHFIDFILSSHVSTDVPFGEKTLRLSTGTEIHVPDMIRSMNATRIIQQYYQYCQQMCCNFAPLGSSSLYKILDCCKASTRKALEGLNNFVADGVAAFEGLKNMIENMSIDMEETTRLCKSLQRAKQYRKSDFKLHVNRSSHIADHCITFGLSEIRSQYYSSTCDHDHDEICVECTNLKTVLLEIKVKIQNNKSEDFVQRLMYDYNEYTKSILAWKAHLLRCVNQDECRTVLLRDISHQNVFLNLDWAMKWNPIQYREGQAAFFGKKGISWHIAVVSTKSAVDDIDYLDAYDESSNNSDPEDDEDEDLDQRKIQIDRKICLNHKIYVHVFDQVTQDSNAVLSILEHIFLQIKAQNTAVENAFIRSDNAACYHSAQTILGLPGLANKTGITIRRFDFSDPQGGKGSSDRYAAVLKSHVRRYLNEGHDISTANQFVAACRSYNGIKNVEVFECQLPPNSTKPSVKISGITKLHNFVYETKGIRTYRAWNIGAGKQFAFIENESASLKIIPLICVTNFSQTNPLINSATNVLLDNVTSVTSKETVVDNQSITKHKLFFCDYEGCISRFLRYGNLLRHITTGTHVERLEKLPMKDFSMISYKSKLDTADTQEALRLEVERIHFSQQNYSHIPMLDQGWALPLSRKIPLITQRVKKFLKAKFDDGELNGIRWQPEAVVNEMKNSKDPESGKYIFNVSELVKVSTVRSFFSRQKTKIRKVNNSEESTYNDTITIRSEECPSDEQENDDEVFQEHLAIDQELQFDEIRSIVMQAQTNETTLPELENSSANTMSKRVLLSFENENTPRITFHALSIGAIKTIGKKFSCDAVSRLSQGPSLKELRLLLETPIDESILSENFTQASIHLIKINTSSSPLVRTQLLQSYTQERFDKLHGSAMLLEKGLVAKNIGDDYSRICGYNQYSSGVHQVHFRIDERTNSCPFLGIISLLDELNLRKITLSSANGWSDLDYTIVNGKNQGSASSNRTIQSGDEVTFMLGCDNREILLEHHRTNRTVRLLIDIEKCPFPWKILVALSSRNGSIRILQ